MDELFGMWRNTRMVVLTAVSAALYAAVLIPFKVLPIIPGVTELRPANAVPIVCSLLFGPAGAWGSAFGNLTADFFGGLGPGDLFGFAGNLLYGFVPYLVWEAFVPPPAVVAPTAKRLGVRLGGSVGLLGAVVTLASVLCATVVGWGLNLLGFHPFKVLGPIVLVNNLFSGAILGPLLLIAVYPRTARARLLYRDILGPRVQPAPWRRNLALLLLVGGTLGGFAAGMSISSGHWLAPWAAVRSDTGAYAVGLGLVPFLLLAVGGLALL